MDQPVNGGSTVDTMYRAGRLARQAKKFDEAKPLLVGAHAAWAVELGEEHEKTLAAANDLALLLKDTGRVAEAEQLYRATYDARKKKLGEDHPDTLNSAGNLAFLLKNTGRTEEAEPLYRARYDAKKKKLGEDHPDTLDSAGNLGILLDTKARKLDENGATDPAALAQIYTEAADMMVLYFGAKHEAVVRCRKRAAKLAGPKSSACAVQ